jgi:hypothetical protein
MAIVSTNDFGVYSREMGNTSVKQNLKIIEFLSIPLKLKIQDEYIHPDCGETGSPTKYHNMPLLASTTLDENKCAGKFFSGYHQVNSRSS